MRLATIAATATVLMLTAASISAMPSVRAFSAVLPAAAKKPAKKKKEKVEYIRSAS
jgi:hypothetical protein